MTAGALGDIRVIDLSRVLAGPYCAMLLADYGADVIKIEQPGDGDPTRAWGPPWFGDQAIRESAYYLTANRNKRGMTLNLKTAAGQAIARRLIATADVVIENFLPGAPAAYGLDYATLAAAQPGLIYCSITGYGQTGPYRDRPGYDFMIQAEGGIMSITGPADGEPHKVGVAVVDITAGLYAVTAILAALHHRATTGRGQWIDVALFDAQLGWLANVASNYLVSGEPPARYGNAHPNIVPYETFPTADGHIAVGIGSDEQWRRFCELAGRPELAEEPRFATNAARVAARGELIGLLREVFGRRPSAEWLAALAAARIPSAPINDVPMALNDPQTAAREMVRTVTHPAGPLSLVGPVARLSETPATVRAAPPLLGEHTGAILGELGYSVEEIDELRRDGVV
ncbi:MAG TPA: CaiB/BaiF CoA-transferase family protein [Promineifilum sp.]|nr:CaiB/BaiF CoA-transferase family protein [Promineifilum sp.]